MARGFGKGQEEKEGEEEEEAEEEEEVQLLLMKPLTSILLIVARGNLDIIPRGSSFWLLLYSVLVLLGSTADTVHASVLPGFEIFYTFLRVLRPRTLRSILGEENCLGGMTSGKSVRIQRSVWFRQQTHAPASDYGGCWKNSNIFNVKVDTGHYFNVPHVSGSHFGVCLA